MPWPRGYPAPRPDQHPGPLRRPGPQTNAAPTRPLALASQMEGPVAQRHRLPDRATPRRLTHLPSPVRPPSQARPKEPKGKLVQASGSPTPHRATLGRIPKQPRRRQHEITHPRIQA
ncbi:putative tnpC protein [Mycobacterium xenopi 4042]|uniref:Putative tnpC protein n=1 Tax=Mycobacterium xenopi 4042 TaxID=1299334 RepID=X7ZC18_MYCXE|nr:putative tnpC protein [Mycobacterium xenopi 4042]